MTQRVSPFCWEWGESNTRVCVSFLSLDSLNEAFTIQVVNQWRRRRKRRRNTFLFCIWFWLNFEFMSSFFQQTVKIHHHKAILFFCYFAPPLPNLSFFERCMCVLRCGNFLLQLFLVCPLANKRNKTELKVRDLGWFSISELLSWISRQKVSATKTFCRKELPSHPLSQETRKSCCWNFKNIKINKKIFFLICQSKKKKSFFCCCWCSLSVSNKRQQKVRSWRTVGKLRARDEKLNEH